MHETDGADAKKSQASAAKRTQFFIMKTRIKDFQTRNALDGPWGDGRFDRGCREVYTPAAGSSIRNNLPQLLVAPRRRSASIKSFEPPPKRTR
jgi:hypothetical protein